MSKILMLLLAAAAITAVMGGAIEITVHPEKLTALPATIGRQLKDGSLLATAKLSALKLRRVAENIIIQDKTKRLELAVLNVSADADRLGTSLKNARDASELLPQAELLLASLKQVRLTAEEAPVDSVAALKEDSAKAFASARESLGKLKEQHQEYEALETELKRLAEALEQQVGTLETAASPSPNPTTTAEAPLKF